MTRDIGIIELIMNGTCSSPTDNRTPIPYQKKKIPHTHLNKKRQ